MSLLFPVQARAHVPQVKWQISQDSGLFRKMEQIQILEVSVEEKMPTFKWRPIPPTDIRIYQINGYK